MFMHYLHVIDSYTVKKGYRFPAPSRDVTDQTLLGGNNLIIPAQGEFGSLVSDIPAGEGKMAYLFFTVYTRWKGSWVDIPVGGRDPLGVAAQVPFPHGMAPVAQASQVLR